MAIIGTFGSYTAARLGIYASQASLNVTGNNIANVNTNGYTRQRMDLRSIYGGAVDRYVSKYSVNIGYGVLTEGVSQLRDPFIDIRYRTEQSNQGQNEFKLKGLDELAATLDEVGDGKGQFGVIERQFNDLLAQLQNLSEKTGSQEYDTLVRKSAETLTNLIRNASKKLGEAYQGQVGEFEANVKEVNTILTNIRNLNESIRKANICGDKALELRDERNLQIDKLSKLVKINVTYDMERIDQYTEVERLNIHLANDKGEDVAELVRGIFVGQLSYQKEPKLVANPNFDETLDPGVGNERYLDIDGNVTDDPTKAAMVGKDGNPTTDINEAEMVDKPSAKEHFDLQIDELKNRWDVVFKDEKTGDVSEVYDIQDTDMIGGLQAIRELLTEEGEFASTGDLGLDPNADIKRGIPYYQKSLDALANRFAEIMNEANQLPIKDLSAAYQTDANGLFLNNADPQTALTITLTLDDGTTVNVRGTDKDGNLLDDKGAILKNKNGDDLNASMLSYKEKQQILTQLQENGKLTEEYEWYKGGPLFTIGDKADTTDGIVASNITISHAWANRQIQVMNTLRPDSIITYPPTAAQYETGGVTWPSANAAPNTTEDLKIAGITVTGAVGTDNLEGLLNQIVTKYNGQNTGWTASLNENKNGLVFTFDTPGVLPEGTKPPVGVTVPVPASPAVYESKAQAWTNPKEGDTITIGGHTYTVVHPVPKDLPTLLGNFVADYNANAAGNNDWTASVGADGKVLFTAKTPGAAAPAAPAGTTQKSPGANPTTRIDDLRLKTAGEDEREVTISHSTANDNIDHIISQIGKKFEYDAAGFPGSDAESNVYFTGTFQEYFTNMSHVLATDQETTSIVLNNHDVQLLKESNNRQSVSGVDLNDEATSMMQFQKSYQAACKLLTTLDAMLNTLINNTI